MTTIIHPLPEEIVCQNQLDLSLDFGLKHNKFCFSNDGRLYVLTTISYYGREKIYQNLLVTIFEPDGMLQRQFDLNELRETLYQTGDKVSCLSILPDNLIAICSENNKTFIFNQDFTQLIAKFDKFHPQLIQKTPYILAGNLAFDLTKDFDDRLLCAVSVIPRRVNTLNHLLLAVSKKPVNFTKEIHLDFINIYQGRGAGGREDIYPYIFQGHKEYKNPSPEKISSLREQIQEKVFNGRSIISDAYFFFESRIVALPDEKFILPVFYIQRELDKWSEFTFVIINYSGELIGHLKGIRLSAESPHLNQDYEIVFDQASQRIVYKNDFAFYFFNLDGELLHKEVLKNLYFPMLKEYRKLKLRACSPDGQLVLLDEKRHASLMAAPIDILGNSTNILLDSLKDFKQNLRQFSQQQKPINHHWITSQKPFWVKI